MKPTKRGDGWWITDVPEGVEEMGPYASKAEAQDDMAGVKRAFDTLEKKCKSTRTKRNP